MISRKEFARIFEVYGNKAKAYITLGANDGLEVRGSRLHRVGIVGNHVVIPCGSSRIVARISSITAADPNFKILEQGSMPKFPNLQKVLELDFIGSINTDATGMRFERGIRSYPMAEDPIFSILDDELRLLFVGELNRDTIIVGNLVESLSEKVEIDTERLFQSHFGVLGSTGSGKTCTLVHLIQSALANPDYKSQHFLILDPHGEYARAFDNEEFGDDVLLIRIGDEDDRQFNNLTTLQTDLPHYFFSFSEYKTLYRPAPQVQEPSLREMIGKVRKKANKVLHNSMENTVAADRPLRFPINDLYNGIFQKNNQDGTNFLGSLGYRIQVLANQPELRFLFHPERGYENYTDFLKGLLGFRHDDNTFYPVTIVDLSAVPRILNLLTTITNLIARMVYDELRKQTKRGERHCCIVLEEAHNYVPRQHNSYDRSDDHDFTLTTFETIAKEGRKYGACLGVSSQRPRDLSETLISQLGTFFIHRLSNVKDKEIIYSAASDVESNILERMPVLSKQVCVIMGDAVKCAAEVLVNPLTWGPDSASTEVCALWREEPSVPVFEGDADPEEAGDSF